MSVPFSRPLATLAASLWAAAAVIWFALEGITASAFHGYSYAYNYISDLGVPEVTVFDGRHIDSPLNVLMNIAFIAQGLLFFAGCVVALRAFRAVQGGVRKWLLALAIVHAVGMLLVGIFHGSQANLQNGLLVFHGLGAILAIVSGNVIAIVAGKTSRRIGAPAAYRVTSIVLGIVGLICLVMLEVAGSTSIATLPEGVWERGSVYAVLAWELFTAIALVVRTRRGNKLA